MSKTLKKIKQKKYGDLHINTEEKDRVLITIDSFSEGWETIEIERSNLPKIIKILQGEVERI